MGAWSDPPSAHIVHWQDGSVRYLRIRRAEKKNALTAMMYDTMTTVLQAANADEGTKAVVILGEPGIFCAGNDIEYFVRMAEQGAVGGPILAFLRALVANRKPLIAGVEGPAVGIGTTLLFHCDYVVATPGARFSTPFVTLGLVPEAGSSLFGPRLLGHAWAFELLVMGREIEAGTALARGLINEIAEPGMVEVAVGKVAAEIAALPPEAVMLSRQLLRGDPAELLETIDREAELFGKRLHADETRRAFMNFLARKK
jgi:enoyl-CoA hydratase/carnithine racemase